MLYTGRKSGDEAHKRSTKLYCAFGIATPTAKLATVNRKTVNHYFNGIRKKLLPESLKETPLDGGEFAPDEAAAYMPVLELSGFAAGKTPVFGLLKRGGKVYVKIVNGIFVNSVGAAATARKRSWCR